MKHVVHRLLWNYEKEEAWLNAMAAKGLSLADYSWGRYVFEETEPGRWTYRIELLENTAKHPESGAYLRFLEGTGVEVVATYMRWAYLRRKAEEGGFDLFSDVESKLAHGRKVTALYAALTVGEILVGGGNVVIGMAEAATGRFPGNLFMGLPVLAIGFLFLFGLLLPLRRRMKRLEAERRIRE